MSVQELVQLAPDAATADPRANMLGLLRGTGLPAATLRAAVWHADRLGVDVVHYILSEGIVDEASLYAELARQLGLPFHDGILPTASLLQPQYTIQTGLCPLRRKAGSSLSFALAPKGALLQRLMLQDLRGRSDLVVMTPSRLAASVRRSHQLFIAKQAAGLHPDSKDRRSARTGLSLGQIIFLAMLIPSLSFSITLAPFDALAAIALAVWPVFLAMVWLRCMAVLPARRMAQHRRAEAPRLTDDGLPVYSVIVPLYREASVLPQLLAALDALDYPRAKLDIMIVTECDDEETQQALTETRLPAHIKVMVMPPGQPKTKPRALNAALFEATGSLVTIYDAEDIPDPQQLRDAANAFAIESAKLGCLQARLVVDNGNDGWLARCFALEYAGLFDALNPGLLARGWPILLGGTSNHFRMSAVRAVGGWDAWNVTEDADLGIQLVRAGYQIADLDSATFEEAPGRPGLWFRQRTRWMKGFMQTIATHTDRPFALIREAGSGATIVLIILSLGTIVSALGYPFFLAAMLMWAMGLISPDLTSIEAQALSGLSVAIFCLGIVAMLLPPALGAVRRRSFDLLAALPLLPIYYGMVSLAAWRALFDCIFAPFHWNKTQHGLARTSRRRDQLTGASATLVQPGPVDAQD